MESHPAGEVGLLSQGDLDVNDQMQEMKSSVLTQSGLPVPATGLGL